MEFQIIRTSQRLTDDTAPCAGCRVETREFGGSKLLYYYKSFEDLEELLAFVNEHGELVISGGQLEIYDDYRE